VAATAAAAAMLIGAVTACDATADRASPPVLPADGSIPAASAGATTPPLPSALRPVDPAELQATVDRVMTENHIPGAVVLLRTPQGEFVVNRGTTELGTQIVPTVDTHVRIASITKSLTAAVILQLVQEGELALEDPISKYVDGVPNGDDITIGLLLEMRSGLFGFTADAAIADSLDNTPTRVWTPQELLDVAFTHPTNFAPDERYEYSNTNYVLLGLVAEEVDGKPLAQSMQERLFGPLGMRDTLLPPADSNAIPAPSSHGYAYGQSATVLTGEPPYPDELGAQVDAGTVAPKDFTDVNHSFAYAAGGVISTAADLATFFEAFIGGEVLDAEYTRILLDSVKPELPDMPNSYYGYGLAAVRWAGNDIPYHSGETVGFNSFAGYDPTNDVTLVVWTNMPVSPETEHLTANDLMLQVLAQTYAISPLG
jgi:D-alanyl-D-alanine carboxypeptidase